MSDTAAATTTTKRNLPEEEVLVGMPPEKKTAATEQCDCARCELREEICAMVLGALEVLRANTDPDSSTVEEEKLRRRASFSVCRSVNVACAQLYELLPGDTRRQKKPPAPGYNWRSMYLRNDYTDVQRECNLEAGLSSRTMFMRFHFLLRRVLDRLHHEMRFEKPLYIDDVTVECGTMCAVVMQNCEGIASCKKLYDQLRAIATALFATIEELKTSPPPPSPCRATQRQSANVTAWAEEDSDTDVDTIPGEVLAAADAVVA